MNDYAKYLEFQHRCLMMFDNGEIDKAIEAQKKEIMKIKSEVRPEDVRPLTKKQAKILKKKIKKIGLPGNHDIYEEEAK